MIRVPGTDKRYSQPNNSDLFGNIYYSKNVNFDNEGYIKLSPRALSIENDGTESDFGLPLAFGRLQGGIFYTVTNGEVFIVTIDEATNGVAQDTEATDDNPPSPDFNSHGKWFNNAWHVSDATTVVSKAPATGFWTDRITGLTSGVVHAIETFDSRTTICVTNGNVVKQYTDAYASSTDLTIPSKYEATCLAYANNKMGVGTKLSSTASGQNAEAYFFIWSGANTSAAGGWPTGSDMIVAVVPYKSSFILLTREGNGLYFNGGGFEILFSLPHYYVDKTWGDAVNREALTDIMKVEGDIVYINVNNAMEPSGDKSEEVLVNAPGGVLCYDPKVGLYHRYSPSISDAKFLTVTASNVNTTTDILTDTSSDTIPATGNPIKYIFDKTDLIGGLQVGKVYYVIKHTASTFSLAETYADAIAGNKVDLTAQSSTTSYFIAIDLKDYGQTRMARTGALGIAEKTTQALTRMVMGAELYRSDSTGDYSHMCFLSHGFKNIGYIVTPRITSNNIEDTYQKVFVKYKPLREGETITVKRKSKDVIGLPVTTPQASVHCTWADTQTIVTTANLAEALTYFNQTGTELECEIISGAGAGQMFTISNMYETGGNYVIQFASAVEGVAANDICDVIIDNWETLGVITSADVDGYWENVKAVTSKFAMYKIIMSGDGVTIEETQVLNVPHKESK